MNLHKIKRTGAVALPSLFTTANMAFGFFSILASAERNFSRAGWFIMFAMLMDMLDGRIARLVKGESAFGVEMDSLADFLSFCLAPAYLMLMFNLKDYGFWGYPVAFIYALCGALRLAKFNVLSHSGKGSKKHFSGLPTPAGAGIIASFAVSYSIAETGIGTTHTIKFLAGAMPFVYGIMPFVMLALAVLMVSKIPYAALKQKNFLNPTTFKGMFLTVLVIFLVIKYPQDALFMVLISYSALGVISALWRAFFKIPQEKSIPPGE